MAQQVSFQQFTQQIQQLLASGQGQQALSMVRGIVRAQPDTPQLRHLLGNVYSALGRHDQARAEFEKVLKQAPDEPRVLLDYAMSCRYQLHFDEAHERVDQVLAADPNNLQAASFKSDLYFLDGRYEESAAVLRDKVEGTSQPHPALLVLYAKTSAAAGQREEARKLLERALGLANLPQPLRVDVLFRLARLQDEAGEYDEAFKTATQANKLRRGGFDAGVFNGLVDETIKTWTREMIEGLPSAADPESERAGFIIGFPRSGMAVVELILASHPEVFGGGDMGDISSMARKLQGMFAADPPLLTNTEGLTATNLKNASHGYLSRLKQVRPEAKLVTNRAPLNFLHLGLIAVIAPKAKIVHVQREPLDACVAAYLTRFASVPFAYSMEDLATGYRAYERLMAHWREVLDLDFVDVGYEELVANPETEVRRLVEGLGLAWDEGCLKFHEPGQATLLASTEQVRRPLTSASVGRAKKYEAHIEPLKAGLGE
jgi:tetratricopeptide (TPR) repeat protein